MIVALHSAPKGFFKTDPPYDCEELLRFVRKAASLGFRAVQIGPLRNFVSIEGERLRRVLDSLNMERSVHVGGIYDAQKFALTDGEYARAQKQIHYGITLCKEISSALVSIHPPFFATENNVNEELLLKAKTRFLELVKEEVNFASCNHIRIALESFCYHPFIFEGLHDFAQFVSKFSPEKLGVLLDVGHVYQIGIDLYEAVHMFKHRLLDVHVHDAALEKDFRMATHLPIGKGTINFPDLINLLRQVKYGHWLTLEIRGKEQEIVESKEYLEGLIKNIFNL
ncbi:MAG: sugar phosphate isomerase/epimerase [Candidatus Bathyarchaeota archaeon]|nr:sugar phosphate isomerase/epimerase [Candidatus Bathyarchaeota archaeon]